MDGDETHAREHRNHQMGKVAVHCDSQISRFIDPTGHLVQQLLQFTRLSQYNAHCDGPDGAAQLLVHTSVATDSDITATAKASETATLRTVRN